RKLVMTTDELLGQLVEAVTVALREMTAVESIACELQATTSPARGDVSAVLPVTTAAGEGSFVLSFPERTAAALAHRVFVLAEAGAEPDAEVLRDCLGEIINVVAGQAKTLLFGTPYHFTLST